MDPLPRGGLIEDGQIVFTFTHGDGFEFKTYFEQLQSRAANQVVYVEPLPLYQEVGQEAGPSGLPDYQESVQP